jgi:hypothetical protein
MLKNILAKERLLLPEIYQKNRLFYLTAQMDRRNPGNFARVKSVIT